MNNNAENNGPTDELLIKLAGLIPKIIDEMGSAASKQVEGSLQNLGHKRVHSIST